MNKFERREFITVVAGGSILALNAGYINSVALSVKAGGPITATPVSHMSGTVTKLGIYLVGGVSNSGSLALGQLSLIIAFYVGSVVTGLLLRILTTSASATGTGNKRVATDPTTVNIATFRLGKAYGHILMLESIALFTAYGLMKAGIGATDMALAFACGLQNSMASTYSGAILRTTHVTGIVTDLGTLTAQLMFNYVVMLIEKFNNRKNGQNSNDNQNLEKEPKSVVVLEDLPLNSNPKTTDQSPSSRGRLYSNPIMLRLSTSINAGQQLLPNKEFLNEQAEILQKAARFPDAWKLGVFFPLLFSFLMGSMLGHLAALELGESTSLLVPAILIALVAVLYLTSGSVKEARELLWEEQRRQRLKSVHEEKIKQLQILNDWLRNHPNQFEIIERLGGIGVGVSSSPETIRESDYENEIEKEKEKPRKKVSINEFPITNRYDDNPASLDNLVLNQSTQAKAPSSSSATSNNVTFQDLDDEQSKLL